MAVGKKAVIPVTLPLGGAAWARVVKALKLSPQQERIVELILRGMRDKQIASAMGLGVPTVRTYLARVFLRAKVRDRMGLVLHVFKIATRFDMKVSS